MLLVANRFAVPWIAKDYCTSPEALKVSVLGSFSFPRAPSRRPLKLTSIPPAFPVLRITDLPALIFFSLSALKTRCITDFPSATIETHESSLALTCTKNAFSFTAGDGGGSAETSPAAVDVCPDDG